MDAERVHFDAELRPHRSLGRGGFLILMLALGGVSFVAGMVFLLMGAWPVFGFFGLDLLLVYIAFKLNYRSGRLVETVRLTDRVLTVERTMPNGRVRSWTFEPYWVRVGLEEASPSSRLTLGSHGRRLTIGGFLTEEERAEFAQALGAALARWRAAPPG